MWPLFGQIWDLHRCIEFSSERKLSLLSQRAPACHQALFSAQIAITYRCGHPAQTSTPDVRDRAQRDSAGARSPQKSLKLQFVQTLKYVPTNSGCITTIFIFNTSVTFIFPVNIVIRIWVQNLHVIDTIIYVARLFRITRHALVSSLEVVFDTVLIFTLK